MYKYLIILFLTFSVTLFAGCSKNNVQEQIEPVAIKEVSEPSPTFPHAERYDKAIIKTTEGDITIKFYNDLSPMTVNNFLRLAEEGFYNGTAFHRIIKNYIIQGGDPYSKESDWSKVGTGDPGYSFKDEINKKPLVEGSLAMANAGPDTNGSQFFIVTAEATPFLNGKHTNFGEVIDGMDVVEDIEETKTDKNNRPLKDKRTFITSIELIEKDLAPTAE